MKRYRVVFTETVNQKIDSQVTYLLEQSGSPETIAAGLSKLLDAIDTLGYGPLRFPIAQEETARKDFEVRVISARLKNLQAAEKTWSRQAAGTTDTQRQRSVKRRRGSSL